MCLHSPIKGLYTVSAMVFALLCYKLPDIKADKDLKADISLEKYALLL